MRKKNYTNISLIHSYTDNQTEFLKAIDKFKCETRKYPTYKDVLVIIHDLGYRKMLIGKRRPDDDQTILEPGEYVKLANGVWYGCTPNGLLATLRGHSVTENPDQTITVSPSIFTNNGTERWHGHLENGIWREV